MATRRSRRGQPANRRTAGSSARRAAGGRSRRSQQQWVNGPHGATALAGEAVHQPQRLIPPLGPRGQLGAGLVSWLALGWTMYHLAPETAFDRGLFLAVLFCAVALTSAPIIYGLSLRFTSSHLSREAAMHRAARQGIMVAGFVVACGVLRLLHAWTGLTALLTLGIFLALELAFLTRK